MTLMTRTLAILLPLFLSLLATASATLAEAPPTSTLPPPVPTCTGKDLLVTLKQSDPEGHSRILKQAEAIANSRALLWRIERDGKAPSYLFGTVHVTDDRVHALSASVREALSSVDRVALEVAFDDTGTALSSLGTLLSYQGERSLKTDLPPERYQALQAILDKRGLPPGSADRTRPWLMMLQLSLPECEQRRQLSGLKSLDQRIADDARARGAKVVGLETIQSQLEAMARLSDADQLALLELVIVGYEAAEDAFETLLLRYLERNIGPVMPLQFYEMQKAGLSIAAIKTFERELIIKRNHTMLKSALPLLERGGLAICVGALHLSGNEGLVELIRAAGYKVAAIE